MVQDAVQKQAEAVADLGNELGSVADGQQRLMAGVSESMATVTQLHEVTHSVEQGMRDSHAVQQELLESERSVAQKLSTLEALHSEHADAVQETWKVSCSFLQHLPCRDAVCRACFPNPSPSWSPGQPSPQNST